MRNPFQPPDSAWQTVRESPQRHGLKALADTEQGPGNLSCVVRTQQQPPLLPLEAVCRSPGPDPSLQRGIPLNQAYEPGRACLLGIGRKQNREAAGHGLSTEVAGLTKD